MRARLHSDSGAHLVELGAAMLISGLIVSLMVTWMGAAGSSMNLLQSDDEALQSLRLAKEQMSQDVRNAGSIIVAESDLLTLWADDDRNGTLDVGETVSWHITATGELTRAIDAGPAGRKADQIDVASSYFAYDDIVASQVANVTFYIVVLVEENGAPTERVTTATIHVRNA
jgi:Tfp pilus assembly protein PilW